MTESLSYLLTKQQLAKTSKFNVVTLKSIASTMAVLYYLKHNQVLGLITKSEAQKSLFSHHIYQLLSSITDPLSALEVAKSYLGPLTESHKTVSTVI